MAERMLIEAAWGYVQLLLKSGEQAEKGKLACLDVSSSGQIVRGKASATLIPFGFFSDTLLGDGVKKVQIKLFREIPLYWLDNDTVAPVAIGDMGTVCAIKDDTTVSADHTGRSAAGLVLGVDSIKGVLVYFALPAHGPFTL